MSRNKTIELIIAPPAPHMVGDGFRVHSFFPGDVIDKRRMSPFFLLDYNSKIDFSPRNEPRGVGVHPHRGFETVTIAYHGSIAHHDSAGNHGVIREGDVQWMTAASGLLHKEYHEEEFSRNGGLFQMVQLWVNLPARYKMAPPKYQEISHNKINKYILPDDKGALEVIAGEYQVTGKNGTSVKGAATTFSPLHVFNARMNKGAGLQLSFPSDYNTGILVIEGNLVIDEKKIEADHFVLFKNDGELVDVHASTNAVALILSGEPIHEPIAQYGPFLMNTWEEVELAIKDVSTGKMGVLEE